MSNLSFESGAVHRSNQKTLFSIPHLHIGTTNQMTLLLCFIYIQQKSQMDFFNNSSQMDVKPSGV